MGGIEILLKQEREGAKSKHRAKSFLYCIHTQREEGAEDRVTIDHTSTQTQHALSRCALAWISIWERGEESEREGMWNKAQLHKPPSDWN